jgi:small subunit ribosomal protein S18
MSQYQSPSFIPSVTGPGGGPAGRTPRRAPYLKTGIGEELYVDYKMVEDLRRSMTPNGKILSRKRLGTTAREQRMLSQAIKRARHMALLPYTDATL